MKYSTDASSPVRGSLFDNSVHGDTPAAQVPPGPAGPEAAQSPAAETPDRGEHRSLEIFELEDEPQVEEYLNTPPKLDDDIEE